MSTAGLLLAAGGFLIGGAYSVWKQGGKVLAGLIGLAAAVALAAGALRL